MELLPLAPGACGGVALSDASYAQIVCGKAGFPDGKVPHQQSAGVVGVCEVRHSFSQCSRSRVDARLYRVY
jgi:hypothetical protein